MVGAVQPDVDERRGRPQHARQAGAAHHAVRRAVPLQQLEDRVVVPARVPELDRDPHPPRQPAEEVVEPGVVALRARGQLHQQHAAPVARARASTAPIRSTQTSGAYSRLAWVSPRGALTVSSEARRAAAGASRRTSRRAASGRSWRSARPCRSAATYRPSRSRGGVPGG